MLDYKLTFLQFLAHLNIFLLHFLRQSVDVEVAYEGECEEEMSGSGQEIGSSNLSRHSRDVYSRKLYSFFCVQDRVMSRSVCSGRNVVTTKPFSSRVSARNNALPSG